MNCDICGIPRSVHDDHRDCVMLLRNRVAGLEAEVSVLMDEIRVVRQAMSPTSQAILDVVEAAREGQDALRRYWRDRDSGDATDALIALGRCQDATAAALAKLDGMETK